MATPSSQPPLAHIKTAARKLPVKRKSPHSSSSTPFLPVKLDHSPNPADAAPAPAPAPASTPAPARPADDFDDDDEEPDPDDVDQDDGDATGRAGGGSIPFKFQRIWSEPDEIRFLQGLLACHSHGMTFPRDLNLYFDRFSETMSQPYSRSQLSEKLRRLRKKFRSHAARVARGLDPSALPPHDRDLFHLSTLLWDPAFAAASPFGASSSRPVPGNKRRRHVPVAGGSAMTTGGSGVRARSSAVSCPRPIHALPPPSPTLALPSPPLPPPPPASCSPPPPPKDAKCDRGLGGCSGSLEEQPPSQQRKPIIGSSNEGLGQLAAKTALDVFDCCLKEVRSNLVRRGLLPSDQGLRSGPEGDLSNKWREQRVAELDVLARRLSLVHAGFNTSKLGGVVHLMTQKSTEGAAKSGYSLRELHNRLIRQFCLNVRLEGHSNVKCNLNSSKVTRDHQLGVGMGCQFE